MRTLNSGFCISGPSDATSTASPAAVVAVPGTMPTCGSGELLTGGDAASAFDSLTNRNVVGGISGLREFEASADEFAVAPGATE